jgi:hypothetical protein
MWRGSAGGHWPSAAAVALLLAVVVAGCGGGGSNPTVSSTTTQETQATTTGAETFTPPHIHGGFSTAGVRPVVETVLTSTDPADVCGKDVTPHYLSVAWGGKRACVQAQRPGVAATSLRAFRIDAEGERLGVKVALASAVPQGGLYDGERITVSLLRDPGWAVDALRSNAPVGP